MNKILKKVFSNLYCILLIIGISTSFISCKIASDNLASENDNGTNSIKSSSISESYSLNGNEISELKSSDESLLDNSLISDSNILSSDLTSSIMSNKNSSGVISNTNPTVAPTNKPSNKPTATPTKPVLSSREKLNDIGAHVWDGYYYYVPPVSTFKGLYKKKINSDEAPIKLAEEMNNLFKVLNGFIYYSDFADGTTNIIRVDTNGKNIKVLYRGYQIIEVAGNWIFATDSKSQLFMLRTDGNKIVRLSPDTPTDYRVFTEILGFDHGFCYYYAQNQWYVKGGKGLITYATEKNRVDYRSLIPYIEKVSPNLSYLDNYDVFYGKAFINQNPYKYIDLNDQSTKIINSPNFYAPICTLDNYIFYTANKIVGDQTYDIYRFINQSNGAITDFARNYNYYYTLHYADVYNNEVYMSRYENKKSIYCIIRYKPDGTSELIDTFKEY